MLTDQQLSNIDLSDFEKVKAMYQALLRLQATQQVATSTLSAASLVSSSRSPVISSPFLLSLSKTHSSRVPSQLSRNVLLNKPDLQQELTPEPEEESDKELEFHGTNVTGSESESDDQTVDKSESESDAGTADPL